MRVEVAPEALVLDEEHHLALAGILALCWLSRHHLIASDERALVQWAATRGLSDVVEMLLDDGLKRETLAGERAGIRVARGPARWNVTPILEPLDALEVLCSPVRVYVENEENDRNFLLAFASTAQRARLEAAQRRGWLVWHSGGGASGVALAAQMVAKQARNAPAAIWRVMVVMDSDAVEPGKPGRSATKAAKHLEVATRALGLAPAHFGVVLRRREAENYIPARDLVKHLDSNGDAGAEISAWEVAWSKGRPAKMPPTDRRALQAAAALRHVDDVFLAHFDFKLGRESRRQREVVIHTADDVWTRAGEHLRPALLHGIGEKECRRFLETARGLSDPSGEVRQLLDQLLMVCDG